MERTSYFPDFFLTVESNTGVFQEKLCQVNQVAANLMKNYWFQRSSPFSALYATKTVVYTYGP